MCTCKCIISLNACARLWILFQFSLTCCHTQYRGVLVHFHMNWNDTLASTFTWLYSHITAFHMRIYWVITVFFFFSQLGLLLLEKCIKTNWLELPLQTPTFLISDFYPSISWILKLCICNSRPKDPFHFHPPLKQQ